jgi:DNA helicase-2/ATP-dependent DNA helicase PcrA
MTLHSAKGLEFEACYIVGLEDHLLPHEKNQTAEKLEEERRLFYVGITRAKKYLTLSMCRSRKKHGKPVPSNPSRFLFEIPKEVVKVGSWNLPEPFLAHDD